LPESILLDSGRSPLGFENIARSIFSSRENFDG
jgi:hypothetical protein